MLSQKTSSFGCVLKVLENICVGSSNDDTRAKRINSAEVQSQHLRNEPKGNAERPKCNGGTAG